MMFPVSFNFFPLLICDREGKMAGLSFNLYSGLSLMLIGYGTDT